MITNGASKSNFMSFLSGSSTHTWQPVMTADTATVSYWLNWRFTLCALFILTSMVVSAVIIWKLEGRKRSEDGEENSNEAPGVLYEDEAWNTCLRSIHPAWLLSFRMFAFFMLLALLLANVAVDGTGIFYFYTQWTFTLVTIYFGFGSAISIYGCQKHWGKVGGDRTDHISSDFEGTYAPPVLGGTANASNRSKQFDTYGSPYRPPRAEFLHPDYPGHILTAISPDFSLFGRLPIDFCRCSNAHRFSVLARSFPVPNSQRLRSEFPARLYALGQCRFPSCGSRSSESDILFYGRAHLSSSNGSSMLVLTSGNVILPVHWWPYPFLDLSSLYAPLWYMGVGLMHIPCYGIFALMIKLKDFALWRSSPESFRKRA
ncbi:hypothetical protein V6N13_108038 [Hibiscus sabdariffa]